MLLHTFRQTPIAYPERKTEKTFHAVQGSPISDSWDFRDHPRVLLHPRIPKHRFLHVKQRMKNGKAHKVCEARPRYAFSSCFFSMFYVAMMIALMLFPSYARKTRVVPNRLFHLGALLALCWIGSGNLKGRNWCLKPFWFLDSLRPDPSHSDVFLCGVIFDPQRNKDLCHTFCFKHLEAIHINSDVRLAAGLPRNVHNDFGGLSQVPSTRLAGPSFSAWVASHISLQNSRTSHIWGGAAKRDSLSLPQKKTSFPVQQHSEAPTSARSAPQKQPEPIKEAVKENNELEQPPAQTWKTQYVSQLWQPRSETHRFTASVFPSTGPKQHFSSKTEGWKKGRDWQTLWSKVSVCTFVCFRCFMWCWWWRCWLPHVFVFSYQNYQISCFVLMLLYGKIKLAFPYVLTHINSNYRGEAYESTLGVGFPLPWTPLSL